uniref:PTS sugar transporter subunit IIA n=1 Tax=candidate division WOR-3 bacterium TaxID=2052148 RepID=A0A7C4TDQ4_UNCW3
MINGIIVGHGNFAYSILETAQGILGKQEGIETISNVGLSCEQLNQKIKEALNRTKSPHIVFVDLPGGSCGISCLNLLREDKNIRVVCGVNLPMLLEFFLLREKYDVDELVQILIKKGRDNIIKLGGNFGDPG